MHLNFPHRQNLKYFVILESVLPQTMAFWSSGARVSLGLHWIPDKRRSYSSFFPVCKMLMLHRTKSAALTLNFLLCTSFVSMVALFMTSFFSRFSVMMLVIIQLWSWTKTMCFFFHLYLQSKPAPRQQLFSRSAGCCRLHPGFELARIPTLLPKLSLCRSFSEHLKLLQ